MSERVMSVCDRCGQRRATVHLQPDGTWVCLQCTADDARRAACAWALDSPMRLVRSWPATVPPGRSHVVDGLERVTVEAYDFRPLADLGGNVLHLEWDIAVGLEQLEGFARRCAAAPDRVRVAAYRLYPPYTGLAVPVWAHRARRGPGPVSPDWHVHWGEPACHWFGFGMVYLPGQLLAAFPRDQVLNDETFSRWHYRTVRDPMVPIEWHIRPVHLHYGTPEWGRGVPG